MEFSVGRDGPIVPEPEHAATPEQLARTQTAMDLFQANAERIQHFKQRVEELGRSGEDTVVTLLNVDDPMGNILADFLMPEYDWQRYRDAGEVPVARGLAAKDGILTFLQEAGYTIAAQELADTNDLRVLVMDAEVALILDVRFETE